MKNKFLQWFAVCGRLGSKLMCIYFLLIVFPLGMFSFYAYLREIGRASCRERV